MRVVVVKVIGNKGKGYEGNKRGVGVEGYVGDKVWESTGNEGGKTGEIWGGR